MKYARIVEYVATTPWAIHRDKMASVVEVLAFRAADQEFTPAEIRSRLDAAAVGRTSPASSRGTVAVLPLRGVIAHRMSAMEESSGGASATVFAAAIRQLAADDSVSAIVIDCDSPGGTITGVPEAAQAVYDAAHVKRVVAVANGMMASAAYWICSQASEVVAIPSIYDGAIGAIGVFCAHADLSAALEKQGVKMTLISAGKYKVSGNPFEPLTAQDQAVLQRGVDAAYRQFTKDVGRGRGVSPAAVENGFGQGRGLSAVDAKTAGLVDRIATMDDTLSGLVGGRSIGSTMRSRAAAMPPAEVQAEHDLLTATIALNEDAEFWADEARRAHREL